MRLSGRLHIERRLNEGSQLQRKHKTKTKQNKTKVTPRERRHDICKPNARRIQVRATCGYSTRASDPARADLLWAILSLVLPVTFEHTTACRSPALASSAAIHFAMECSAPYSAVLCHPPSSWAAVVHWSALMPKALRSSRKHPIHSFSWPPYSPPPTLRTSRTSGVSYPPCAPQIPQTRSASCSCEPLGKSKRSQPGVRVNGTT